MSDYICEELILKIFTKLPPKSLLRFRSLSKSLRSHIYSPDFIRAHTFQSLPKFLIRHRICPEYEEFYTLHSQDQLPLSRSPHGYDNKTTFKVPYANQFKIFGSCNGILCMYEPGNVMSLWNPSVRRKLNLPYLTLYTSPFSINKVAVGFGYDSVTDDYKIVLISYSEYKDPPENAYVYAVKSDAWVEIPFPTATFNNLSSQACFFNGAFHWIAGCHAAESNDVGRHYILRFDLSTHVFGTIVLPEPNWGSNNLAIMKGSLAVISTGHANSGIWLREYKNTSWYEVYKSKTAQFTAEKIFEVTTNGNILLHTFYRAPIVYDLETEVELRIKGFNECSPKVDVEKYVETLELLGKGKAYEARQPTFLRPEEKTITYIWDD